MKPDLNLLVILDALCRFGSVSKASEALSLSQPAVSHALNRLRVMTGDPLFTRSGRGLVPTPRARAMAEEVAGIVAAAQASLRPERFDPAQDEVEVRLGLSDYAGLTLFPKVVAAVRAKAPRMRIGTVPVGQAALRQLEEGALDLCFWGTAPPEAPFRYLRLFGESFVVVLRAGHPALAGEIGLERWLGLDHAVVSLGDPGQSPVETALAARGLARRVMLASLSFAANLAVVAASDLVATVPARLAAGMPERLVVRPLPLAVPEFDYGMIWHPRGEVSPALRWLRGVIVAVAGGESGEESG